MDRQFSPVDRNHRIEVLSTSSTWRNDLSDLLPAEIVKKPSKNLMHITSKQSNEMVKGIALVL